MISSLDLPLRNPKKTQCSACYCVKFYAVECQKLPSFHDRTNLGQPNLEAPSGTFRAREGSFDLS